MNKYLICTIILLFASVFEGRSNNPVFTKVKKVLRKDIVAQAKWALKQTPITVTETQSERSAGGLHDFFSEGDYWWPDPTNPSGPYIQKDGLTNPDNFTAHRQAMVRFSRIIGSLASAYILTDNEKYTKHAATHLRAWFIDTSTMMNPSLLYAQAIKGKVTGRSIGIIDMIQMIEVAQGLKVMEKSSSLDPVDIKKIKSWFSQYLTWVTTHPYGIEERDTKNNHAVCWVMQVAVFAHLVENESILEECKTRFKKILLPNQMDMDGSFPLELKRTKPYGYSLFVLDAMATICHVLSNTKENLWDFTLDDGRCLKKGVEFMYPFVENKNIWKNSPDVMYWNEWPVAQPFLLFGFSKFKNEKWYNLWEKLDHFPNTEEVIRNLPVRNPLIWIEK
jgi:hypothetical protein